MMDKDTMCFVLNSFMFEPNTKEERANVIRELERLGEGIKIEDHTTERMAHEGMVSFCVNDGNTSCWVGVGL
jgi:hypothetical protein